MEFRLANFTIAEITKSNTAARLGIDNSIPEDMLLYWKSGLLFLELIRHEVGAPIMVNSGYRCSRVNSAIPGSSPKSHHTGKTENGQYCCAFDIEIEESNAKLFHAIRGMYGEGFQFDQLIWEYGNDVAPAWVHVGFVFGVDMRGEVLRKRTGSRAYEVFA